MERLNLRPDIEALLEFNGYEKLMEIQTMVLPHMRAGENIMAEAPTGSGKTLAYLLPMLERLNDDKKVKLLIIAPTKELVPRSSPRCGSSLRASSSFRMPWAGSARSRI